MGKVNKIVLLRELRRIQPVNKNDQRPLNWELRRTNARSKYAKRLFCLELKNAKTRHSTNISLTKVRTAKRVLGGKSRRQLTANKDHQRPLNEDLRKVQGNKCPVELKTETSKDVMSVDMETMETTDKESENAQEWENENADSQNVTKTRVAQSKRKKTKNALSGELRKLQAANKNDQTPLIGALRNTEEKEKYAKRLFLLELKASKTRSKTVWPQENTDSPNVMKTRGGHKVAQIKRQNETTLSGELRKLQAVNKNDQTPLIGALRNTEENEKYAKRLFLLELKATKTRSKAVWPQVAKTPSLETDKRAKDRYVDTSKPINETCQDTLNRETDNVKTIGKENEDASGWEEGNTKPQSVVTNETANPQTDMTNKTANPQTVMQDTVVNAQGEEIFETSQTTPCTVFDGTPSSQFVGYYYYDGTDKKAHSLLLNLCRLNSAENPRHKMRMSKRLTTTIVKEQMEAERELYIEKKLRENCEDGLKVVWMGDKGRGVVSTREFQKGDFVLEYTGELISKATASQREARYAQDAHTRCYMFYFTYEGQRLCVDATAETGRLARLVNHSRRGNCRAEVAILDHVPHVIFLADRQIPEGEEITVDYGDRSAESVKYHPWLRE